MYRQEVEAAVAAAAANGKSPLDLIRPADAARFAAGAATVATSRGGASLAIGGASASGTRSASSDSGRASADGGGSSPAPLSSAFGDMGAMRA